MRTFLPRFMKRVHEELRTLKGEKNPLTIIARRFADEARVICFATTLRLRHHRRHDPGDPAGRAVQDGVSLVATSNIVPDGLYKDGLQRARFLPAIALLKEHTEIVNVDSGVDYRLRALEQAQLFHYPLSDEVEAAMAKSFRSLTVECNDLCEDVPLMIENREIRARPHLRRRRLVRFPCPLRRSAQPERLHRAGQDLPDGAGQQRRADGRAQGRHGARFINLVDEFYDRQVKLILSAEVELKDLYSGGRLEFEFQRTLSRLLEMQIPRIPGRPHKP